MTRALGPLLALIAVASTYIGGRLALRLKDRLSLVMAFTGGVVLGVALLDVLPEAADRLESGRELGLWTAVGFASFFLLSRLLVLHHRDDADLAERHSEVGVLGAAALSTHSFIDGFGIGAAFVLSRSIGFVVLVAVVAHDFADGMNTVTFVLSQHGASVRAHRWLVIDSVAPFAGAIAGSLVTVSGHVFGAGLAVYAGVFLVIGATELLPAGHTEPSAGRVVLTLAGFALLFVVARLATP